MGKRLYRFGLLLTVTLTGMAVLIIEISATRILTPYFGNSIFTFSSVISTILAALSLGYYFGGRLSDQKPSEGLFFCLIIISGFTVLLLQLLNATLIPEVAFRLSLIDGPLIVSVMLFLLPAIFLGMLSPFAIKLVHARQAVDGVGNAAGLVFFWSTLGSIVGSLSAGFLLIPRWGTDTIIIGVGTGLILLGGTGVLIFSNKSKSIAIVLILLGLATGATLSQLNIEEGQGVIYVAPGLYEKIVIRDIKYQGRSARVLLQDRNINSGMYLDDGRMTFDYTKYFDLYRLFKPELDRALAIGGGAYSVPKAILRDSPKALIDVAEIEPSLHGLAIDYFGLPNSTRLSNHVLDGRRFLHDSQHKYDLIFLDVYRAFASVPMQFTTQEFFNLVGKRLSDDGVFIANYYGSLAVDIRPVIYSVLKTMRSVFPQVYLIATVNPESEELQNFIFIGHQLTIPDQRIELKKATRIKFAYPELNSVAELELHPVSELLESAILLTDNYSPVEYYAANLIRQIDASSKVVK